MDEVLRNELVRMVEQERRLKAELAEQGSSEANYPPPLRALHRQHADELERIVDAHGWPGLSRVGAEGAEAAWAILQNAISRPDLMKRFFTLLEAAVEQNEADPKHLAYLTDGIRFFSRRPQVYGCYFDWDENGRLVPWIIEDPAGVNERRRRVGLNTMEERIEEMARDVRDHKCSPPGNYSQRQSEMNAFLKQVGWV